MFAIGHFALGYLTGKGASKLLNTKLNMPILLSLSVLPDSDLILQTLNPELFMHRGPAHSIVTFALLMIPFFLIYRKQAIPYFVVLLSHSLLGDLFTGGIEMLWPVTTEWFGDGVAVNSTVNVAAELILFAVVLPIMLKIGDLQSLWKPRSSNMLLIVAFGAVSAPVLQLFVSHWNAIPVPLAFPSLIWAGIFAYALITSFAAQLDKQSPIGPKPNDSSKRR